MKDLLRIPEPGDPLSASQQAIIVKMLRSGFAGAGAFVDSTGVYVRPAPRQSTTARYRGKLDEDLDYDDTEGVTFSIWALDDDNAWADTDEDIENVLPPFELAHAMVPSGVKIEIEQKGGKWYVSKFPLVYEGTLAGALAVSGTATVTVDGDSFTGCKAGNTQSAEIPSSSDVTITLKSDGYYYVTLAPC